VTTEEILKALAAMETVARQPHSPRRSSMSQTS